MSNDTDRGLTFHANLAILLPAEVGLQSRDGPRQSAEASNDRVEEGCQVQCYWAEC